MSEMQKSRSTVIRGKLESAYGQESAPGVNDVAFEVMDLSYKRLEGSRGTRDTADPMFGHKGELPTKHHSSLGFSTYIKKVSSPGDKPSIDPMLQACGFAVSIHAGVNSVYNAIQHSVKSMTFWAYLNGHLHKTVGARGSLSISGELGSQAKATFSFLSLLKNTPADSDFPETAAPMSCINALDETNTSITLHGVALDMVSFSVDVQNTTQHVVTSKGEQIVITDRASTGELVVIKPSIADFNYHAKESDPCLRGPLEIVADAMKVVGGSVSVGVVTDLGDHNGISTITIPVMFHRDEGNDDIVLEFS